MNKTWEWQIILIPDVKFDIREDPTLQNSSQEPSRSSKYDCVLYALLIMLGSWKSAHNSIMKYYGYLWCQIWYQIWPNSSKLQWDIINVLKVWLCFWCTYNQARELKIWIQVRNDKWCRFIMSNLISATIQSSKTSTKNHQCPQSMTVFIMYF